MGTDAYTARRRHLRSKTPRQPPAMGKFFDEIPDQAHVDWLLDQKIFFVGSAPLSAQGHVNVSPKGRNTFTLVDRKTCWYTDMTGSGNESLSHLYEDGNGRITVMFIAFDGPPRIVRLFGKGKVLERGTPEFHALLPEGDERILPGTRGIIWVDVHKVGTSCGYSVPYFSYEGERLILDDFFKPHEDSEADDGGIPTKLRAYWNLKNSVSVDGMPGLKNADDPSKSLEPPFRLPEVDEKAPRAAMCDNAGERSTKGQKDHSVSSASAISLEPWQVLTLLVAAFVMGVIATAGVVQIHSLYTARDLRL